MTDCIYLKELFELAMDWFVCHLSIEKFYQDDVLFYTDYTILSSILHYIKFFIHSIKFVCFLLNHSLTSRDEFSPTMSDIYLTVKNLTFNLLHINADENDYISTNTLLFLSIYYCFKIVFVIVFLFEAEHTKESVDTDRAGKTLFKFTLLKFESVIILLLGIMDLPLY
jgi:hypothetical protein